MVAGILADDAKVFGSHRESGKGVCTGSRRAPVPRGKRLLECRPRMGWVFDQLV